MEVGCGSTGDGRTGSFLGGSLQAPVGPLVRASFPQQETKKNLGSKQWKAASVDLDIPG